MKKVTFEELAEITTMYIADPRSTGESCQALAQATREVLEDDADEFLRLVKDAALRLIEDEFEAMFND